MTTESPRRVGRYELLEFLGGGMSHVYRAKDTTIGRIVALKILTPEGCADEVTRDRFLQEARMAGNVSHENILNIYDYGDADGQPFLVMEFLQGEDLRLQIREQTTGDVENKIRIALQVARAIEYVHKQKIVHRDIKPDNIRVLPGGVVKLMDFGIAKVEGLARTQAGFVVGTPYYMAPEQVRGDEITTLVDVYAFGILVFELFAGVRPMKGEDFVQIFHSILNEPVDLTPLRQAGAPERIIALVEQSTSKDPALRPQSFSIIIARLEAELQVFRPTTPVHGTATTPSLPSAPPPAVAAPVPVEPAKPKRGWLIGLAAAVGILVAIAIVVALMHRGTAQTAQEHPASAPPASASPVAAAPVTPAGMIAIPQGDFLAGEKRDKHYLPAFYIDREEVSAGDYVHWAEASGRPVPESLRGGDPHLPATDITFEDAAAYAAAEGKRLPAFYEWERAARGVDGLLFPWGAGKASANINHPKNGPWPVDHFGNDESPDGVVNMAGNVSEWVDQKQTPAAADLQQFAGLTPPATAAEPWYTMRGGSYMLPVLAAQSFAYQALPARFHSPALGFRCAKSEP